MGVPPGLAHPRAQVGIMMLALMLAVFTKGDWLIDYLTDNDASSFQSRWLIDWLIDWLTDWLTDWLIDWLTYWLIYWLTHWLIDWLIDWLTDSLTDWLIDWLTDWLNDSIALKTVLQASLITLLSIVCFIREVIGHFRVLLCLFFKTSVSAKPFLMKMSSTCSFIFMQIKVIFIRMVSHLDLLWNRGTRELGNGLFLCCQPGSDVQKL